MSPPLDTMWFLMLGHFLGDYAFQSDSVAKTKGTNAGVLILHVVIYVLTVGVLYYAGRLLNGSLPVSLLHVGLACAGLAIIHSLQDFGKANWFSCSKQAYYVDQGLHIVQLFILRIWLG